MITPFGQMWMWTDELDIRSVQNSSVWPIIQPHQTDGAPRGVTSSHHSIGICVLKNGPNRSHSVTSYSVDNIANSSAFIYTQFHSSQQQAFCSFWSSLSQQFSYIM